MAKVIKSFHGVVEHRDFLVGDEYVGEREKELIEKGYLEKKTEVAEEFEEKVEEEVKAAPTKKTTTKAKTATEK